MFFLERSGAFKSLPGAPAPFKEGNIVNARYILRQHELQDQLGLSRNAIERLIATGELKPPILLGSRSKGFLVAEVEEFLAQRAARRDASAYPERPCR